MAAAQGNSIDPNSIRYCKTEAAITVAPNTALCVVYTGSEYGEVKLPAADGAQCAGFLYKSTSAAAEEGKMARNGLFWVPVAEAISINDELMCETTTGHVKVLTATKYKVGVALTDMATEHGYVLVDTIGFGSKEET